MTTRGARDLAGQTLNEALKDDLIQLVRLAMREDLDRGYDLTTVAIVPEDVPAEASIVARIDGVAAGLDLASWIMEAINCSAVCRPLIKDGEAFPAGTHLATVSGDARDVLTSERTLLNFLGRLCGIATWTRLHVDCIKDLPAQIYDTRKTTPGWRRLEKYAVRCGGARNHRFGLYDAILIKDNHLACYHQKTGQLLGPVQAIEMARRFIDSQPELPQDTVLEIEVDTLKQLSEALPAAPDIILLDNMSLDELQSAVQLRDTLSPHVQLEASGGVNLKTLRSIAETGVDRISIGGLTHSAVNLDLGLDWNFGRP